MFQPSNNNGGQGSEEDERVEPSSSHSGANGVTSQPTDTDNKKTKGRRPQTAARTSTR